MKHAEKKYLVIDNEKLIKEIAKDFPVKVQEYEGKKIGLVEIEDFDHIPEKLQYLVDDGIEIL